MIEIYSYIHRLVCATVCRGVIRDFSIEVYSRLLCKICQWKVQSVKDGTLDIRERDYLFVVVDEREVTYLSRWLVCAWNVFKTT